MPGWFKQVEVVRIDASGLRIPVPGITVNIRNLTTGAAITTATVNSDGILLAASITGTVGDIIEFWSPDFPGTLRQTLATTQAEAAKHPDNSESSYIAQSLFTTATVTTTAEVYAEDISDPSVKPFFLGNAKAGSLSSFPYATVNAKNLRLRMVSKDPTGNQSAVASDLSDAKTAEVLVAPTGSQRLLFENFNNAPTTGIVKETLYSDTIDAGTWSTDGDVLEAEYAGFFAANGNTKFVVVEVASTQVANISVTENNTKWSIEIEVMRVSNTSLKVSGTLSYGTAGNVTVINQTITSLNLTTTDYDVLLQGTTPTASGDLTVTHGFGKFWKGTGLLILTDDEGVDYLTDEGTGYTLTS